MCLVTIFYVTIRLLILSSLGAVLNVVNSELKRNFMTIIICITLHKSY